MDTQTTNPLIDFVYNKGFEAYHRDLKAVAEHDLFRPHHGLNMRQIGELAYQRSRHIHSQIEPPLEVLARPERLFALAEWAGIQDVSCFSLVMVHYNLTMGTFFDHGLKQAGLAGFVEELNNLTSFGPYMATELGYGNNVASLKTQAVYSHEDRCFYLSTPDLLSQKYMSYSGFSHIPKIAVVMARLNIKDKDVGVFPFAVRLSDEQGLRPGISAVPCPEKPVQGLDNGLTAFDRVRVELDHILMGDMAEITEEGEFVPHIKNVRARFLKSMSRIMPGRLCVASSGLGGGKASLYIALKYAQNRLTNAPGAGSTEIINFSAYQRDVLVNLARTYAMIALTNDGKTRFVAEPETPDAELMNQINITKALVTWEMTDVIANCRERCGAQGIFSVNKITDYISLLQGLVTAEGDNQVLIATAAGQLINQAAPELDPHVEDEVFSAANLASLACLRERALHQDIANRRDAFDGSFFDEWNLISNDAIALARLRGMRLALNALRNWRTGCAQSDDKLQRLAQLFGLYILQQDAAWYALNGDISQQHILSVSAHMDELCRSLVGDVNSLIDAFGYDEAFFHSPLCYPQYEQHFTDYSKRAGEV